MGFRDPIKSASAVDTGDTAGVRMYGNAANPGRGVVQWYVGGATAEATLSSSQTGSGPSSWSTTYDVSGGHVDLSHDELPAGGYRSRAIVAGPDVVELWGQTVDLVGPGTSWSYARVLQTPDPIVVGYAPGWGPWGDQGYKHLRFTLLACGTCHVSGICLYLGGGGALITGVGGEFSPRNGSDILQATLNDTARQVEIRPDGLYLRGALPAVNSWVAVNGTYLAYNRTTA